MRDDVMEPIEWDWRGNSLVIEESPYPPEYRATVRLALPFGWGLHVEATWNAVIMRPWNPDLGRGNSYHLSTGLMVALSAPDRSEPLPDGIPF